MASEFTTGAGRRRGGGAAEARQAALVGRGARAEHGNKESHGQFNQSTLSFALGATEGLPAHDTHF